MVAAAKFSQRSEPSRQAANMYKLDTPKGGDSMGILDDLFKTAGTVGPKKGGSGKQWSGGHESTRQKADGTVNHHSKNHKTGKTRGWDHNPRTGKTRKY